MTKRSPVRRGVLRVRAYPVLEQAIETGVAFGWSRSHKHEAHPDEETVKEHMEREVLNAICEAFDFPEDDDA